MSELLLLRHGTAEDHGSRPHDADRRLVARGEEEARAAGRALVALDRVPDVVIASPKVRARQTADLAATAWGGAVTEHLAVVGLDVDEALGLATLGPRVLIVGHEPDLSQVVHDLTGARTKMRKGGVAVLRVGGGGRLEALLGPRELERVR
ncbi:MAG: histidine phosphatase family protein [Patulibacter sp.]